MMTSQQHESARTFSLVDYLVFSLMLLISTVIGFYYAWKERNKKHVDQVLLGGRKLQVNYNISSADFLYLSDWERDFNNNNKKDISGCHVNNGQLHVGHFHSGLRSRNVSIRLNVLVNWRLLFHYSTDCCSHFRSIFSSSTHYECLWSE